MATLLLLVVKKAKQMKKNLAVLEHQLFRNDGRAKTHLAETFSSKLDGTLQHVCECE